MAVVRMWIDKFQGEVLINEDHPLAIAQRAKVVAPPVVESAVATDTPSALEPAVSTSSDSPVAPTAAKRRNRAR